MRTETARGLAGLIDTDLRTQVGGRLMRSGVTEASAAAWGERLANQFGDDAGVVSAAATLRSRDPSLTGPGALLLAEGTAQRLGAGRVPIDVALMADRLAWQVGSPTSAVLPRVEALVAGHGVDGADDALRAAWLVRQHTASDLDAAVAWASHWVERDGGDLARNRARALGRDAGESAVSDAGMLRRIDAADPYDVADRAGRADSSIVVPDHVRRELPDQVARATGAGGPRGALLTRSLLRTHHGNAGQVLDDGMRSFMTSGTDDTAADAVRFASFRTRHGERFA